MRLICLMLFLVGSLLACSSSGPPLVIGPDGLPEGQIGQPYKVVLPITKNQGPVEQVRITGGVLPGGLVLLHKPGEAQAEISGTPEEAADTTIRITASVKTPKQTGEQDFRLIVR